MSQDIYFVVDLSFHLDSESNSDSLTFLDTLAVCGLIQHFHEPTHQKGHILNMVITKDTGSTITDVTASGPGLCDQEGSPGDRYAVSFCTDLAKPRSIQKQVTYRKLCAFKVNEFQHSIRVPTQVNMIKGSAVELVETYHEGL